MKKNISNLLRVMSSTLYGRKMTMKYEMDKKKLDIDKNLQIHSI